MQVIENLKVKEKVYKEKLENGLTVMIIPKPGMKKKYMIWDVYKRQIDRLSKLVIEEEEYMDKQVKKVFNDLLLFEDEKEIQIDLKKFNNLEKVIKSRLILYTITRIFGSSEGIEKIHIEDIIKLCSNNIGNKFLTPNKNIKILVKNHKIYFLSQV